MNNTNNKIVSYNIKQLLANGDQYIIPIYQRNYAWGKSEIIQLIQDIIDYCPWDINKEITEENNYYLGTLVVYERQDGSSVQYEVIDGQQRLTTLSILICFLKNNYTDIDWKWISKLNLKFESRPISNETLQYIWNGDLLHLDKKVTPEIVNGYKQIENGLFMKLKEHNIDINLFYNYFINKVHILRVLVPSDTDLNHYFEIMNNRGEQLEKHEILKATMIAILNKEYDTRYTHCFSAIWETCSNMERYVQYGFIPSQRDVIFGKNDWNTLQIESLDDLDHTQSNDISVKRSLSDILNDPTIGIKEKDYSDDKSGDSERFNSIINFPNFLLHVLRIQCQKDITLDDKRLLSTFQEELNQLKGDKEKACFVKTFGFNLLKCRFLFDKYILKRDAEVDQWSLKRLKCYEQKNVSYVNTFEGGNNDDNENCLMLLAMFHVSTPTWVYKHWLNAALNYVFNHPQMNPSDYMGYLEVLAKTFMLDRYLAESKKDYFEIVYLNNSTPKNTIEDLDLSSLTFGKTENNLVFNYLDYLLWKEDKTTYKDFKYTFRSSVEHYYPRHPMENFPQLSSDVLDSFGNLCLISDSQNSRLSNFTPKAKKEFYEKQPTADSIKQKIMMNYNEWGEESIKDHNKKMIDILRKNLSETVSRKTDMIEDDNQERNSIAEDWFQTYQVKDKALLARALMCFDQIDERSGRVYSGEKWNFYHWLFIKQSDAYRKFCEYIKTYNPNSLDAIIEEQLKNSSSLKEESYRFTFVSHPELLDYCKEGNFGWVNGGEQIILMEGQRIGTSNACDLYNFFLRQHINQKYNIDPFCDSEVLYISLQRNHEKLDLIPFNWGSDLFFEIWNNAEGQLCYRLNTRKISKNSKLIQSLSNKGWNKNSNGYYFYAQMEFLLKLTEDIEKNINKSFKNLDKLLALLEVV